MAKSKFFRVFVEGDTTDGRVIQRSWIEQMAKNYNTTKFGARVWLEHLRGILPDSVFRAYGDVLAVKAEEIEIDGEKRLALYAQIDPTPDLVAMNKARQKIYSSAELDPDFAKSGEAYLVGLAVTDNPASLCVEMLAFSANAETNPLAARKQSPENIFTAAVEFSLELEEETEQGKPGLLDRIKSLFSKQQQETRADFSQHEKAIELIAEEVKDQQEAFSAQLTSEVTKQLLPLKESHNKLAQDFADLQQKLATEDPNPNRPQATGGDGRIRTDC